jgi:hypothetical protein
VGGSRERAGHRGRRWIAEGRPRPLPSTFPSWRERDSTWSWSREGRANEIRPLASQGILDRAPPTNRLEGFEHSTLAIFGLLEWHGRGVAMRFPSQPLRRRFFGTLLRGPLLPAMVDRVVGLPGVPAGPGPGQAPPSRHPDPDAGLDAGHLGLAPLGILPGQVRPQRTATASPTSCAPAATA